MSLYCYSISPGVYPELNSPHSLTNKNSLLIVSYQCLNFNVVRFSSKNSPRSQQTRTICENICPILLNRVLNQ